MTDWLYATPQGEVNRIYGYFEGRGDIRFRPRLGSDALQWMSCTVVPPAAGIALRAIEFSKRFRARIGAAVLAAVGDEAAVEIYCRALRMALRDAPLPRLEDLVPDEVATLDVMPQLYATETGEVSGTEGYFSWMFEVKFRGEGLCREFEFTVKSRDVPHNARLAMSSIEDSHWFRRRNNDDVAALGKEQAVELYCAGFRAAYQELSALSRFCTTAQGKVRTDAGYYIVSPGRSYGLRNPVAAPMDVESETLSIPAVVALCAIEQATALHGTSRAVAATVGWERMMEDPRFDMVVAELGWDTVAPLYWEAFRAVGDSRIEDGAVSSSVSEAAGSRRMRGESECAATQIRGATESAAPRQGARPSWDPMAIKRQTHLAQRARNLVQQMRSAFQPDV